MSYAILIVDDEENARLFISTFLNQKGYEVLEAATLQAAREHIQHGKADIILLDVNLPDGNGLNLLQELICLPIHPPVILMTAFGDIDMAVEAMKSGATDFLEKPIKFEQLENSLKRAKEDVALKRELAHLRQVQQKELDFILGENPKIRKVFDEAQRAAAASVSVLITGDTGSGKEVLARAIHKMGPRANKPFVAINSAAIQNTVLESELFGYERGAFTGAEKRKHGLMEIADGGILFLDEISAMSLDVQAKILRAVEEQSFRRVGGTNLIHVDVQIIAASNRDLKKMIDTGEFRDDLYYRFKVVDLEMPPLREHKEDIPELVGLFIRKYNPHRGLNITGITPLAMEALMIYDWPGNVRDLSTAIERAMIVCDDAMIDLGHLPKEVINQFIKERESINK